MTNEDDLDPLHFNLTALSYSHTIWNWNTTIDLPTVNCEIGHYYSYYCMGMTLERLWLISHLLSVHYMNYQLAMEQVRTSMIHNRKRQAPTRLKILFLWRITYLPLDENSVKIPFLTDSSRLHRSAEIPRDIRPGSTPTRKLTKVLKNLILYSSFIR